MVVVALATTGCAPAADPKTETVVTETQDIVTFEVPTDDSASTSLSDRPTSTAQGLSGQVVDADGAPVADAVILVDCRMQPCPPLPDIGVLTNQEGRFHWPLPEGQFTLVAQSGSMRSAVVAVTVTGQQQDPVVLTMPRTAE